MTKTSPRAFDAVIFDIDNVLIDTRLSYLEAIRWTVELYLTAGKIPLFLKTRKSSSPQLLSEADVSRFKLLGGFNDDWDCCYGLLTYILSLPFKKRTLEELKKCVHLEALLKRPNERPLGVNGIIKLFGRSPAVTVEKIARIFQEVYLGRELFETREKRRAVYWKKRGLMMREKLIFKKNLLAALRKAGLKLGIATGRPHYEAHYALKRFEALDLFDAMTTMDEVKAAEATARKSLRKPHPFSLLETARKLAPAGRFIYVGDLPDDILAAQKAGSEIKMLSAAFPWYGAAPKSVLSQIEKMKPDFILKSPSDLLKLAR